MLYEKDQLVISEFHEKSAHSISSVKSYQTVFNKYCSFHEMSLSALLEEAISEQKMRIPENKLSIYDRILSFRNFLVENNKKNTVINSISKIKTFYQYNRVTLPFIPSVNSKNLKKK